MAYTTAEFAALDLNDPTVRDRGVLLPKPARVEKWQRWRNQGREYVIGEQVFDDDAWEIGGGAEVGEGILGSRYWSFLGYAKPDKVEVGQRWRDSRGATFVAIESAGKSGSLDKWALRKEGDDGQWFGVDMIDPRSKWEYLGMAESAGAKKEVPRFAPVVLAGLQSVIAAKTEYATVDDPGAPPVQTKRTADQARQDARRAMRTVQQLEAELLQTEARRANAYAPTDTSLANAFRGYVPDIKAEARRANEEAAKRLIANPPEWACPRAWTCAVLWFCERAERIKHGLAMFEHGGAAWMYLGMFHCLRSEGKTVEEAARLAGSHSTPLVYELVGAYARGMERPSPLMGRPGVKGGISTCDLGADYE